MQTFNIYATYVEEEFINTETVRPEFGPGCRFRLIESRLTLSAAGGAAEAFTIMLDSGLGDKYDNKVYEKPDMTLVRWDTYNFGEEDKVFEADDVLYFTYGNTNSRNWGLEVIFQLIDA